MTHPQVEQAMQKADEFLAAYPTLCQYGTCLFTHNKTATDLFCFFGMGQCCFTIEWPWMFDGLNGLEEIAVHLDRMADL